MIDLADADVLRDPFTAWGRVRERTPLTRLEIPGLGRLWVLTRYEQARAMLGDPRLEINAGSFLPPDVPEHCRPYLRTMTERPAPEHARLRAAVAPAFSARSARQFRPRIEAIVERLLDELPGGAETDLLADFARPLPIEVICELVGIPEVDRPRWREYGKAIAAGSGQGFAAAIPGIIGGATAAVARRRAEPGADLLSELTDTELTDTELTDTELITLVWHLVLAGQTPANLIGNALAALLTHPGELAVLWGDPGLMPGAVEELIRWCGPMLLSIPRYAREDVELCGTLVREGEPVSASIAAANRDPRVFPDPERLDVTRAPLPHLGFAYGPHFCLGAALARVQTEVALSCLLRRFPNLALAAAVAEIRAPDPGTWRLTTLPVLGL